MKTTLLIPIHSLIDLITNSSSEVFVTSDRETLSKLRSMIDAILVAGSSTKKCEDLFKLSLRREDGGYGDYNVVAVSAVNPNSVEAAKLLDQINSVFMAETIGND